MPSPRWSIWCCPNNGRRSITDSGPFSTPADRQVDIIIGYCKRLSFQRMVPGFKQSPPARPGSSGHGVLLPPVPAQPSASSFCGEETTGMPGLMMPAFSPAIRVRVLPEHCHVVVRKGSDHRHPRCDHIGRVQPAAQAHLDHRGAHLLLGKI